MNADVSTYVILTSTQMAYIPGWELALVPVSQPGLRIRD